MQQRIVTTEPFSFAQTLTFLRRFPPCQGQVVFEDDAVTTAISLAGHAVPFTLRGGTQLTLEVPGDLDATSRAAIATTAAHWIGASDDLAELYAAAETDPPFRALIEKLHGLHHVRFLTLEEIAVYCVMMQRAPVALASAMKRRFLDRFGLPVDVAGNTLRAMPEMSRLVELDGAEIGEAIRNKRKGAMIATVARGVAVLGEAFLREAPYAEARDALLEIDGVGPFSATAILLRGLGRMDELAPMTLFAEDARVIYGRAYDEAAIARRYGKQIGYWSFYLKTGVARLAAETITIRR